VVGTDDLGLTFAVTAQLARETIVAPARLLSLARLQGVPWASPARPRGSQAFRDREGVHETTYLCAVAIEDIEGVLGRGDLDRVTLEDAMATRAGVPNERLPQGVTALLISSASFIGPWSPEHLAGAAVDLRRGGLLADLRADLDFYATPGVAA